MLTTKDCADFYGLSYEEVDVVEKAMQVPFVEACAIVEMMNNSEQGRQQLMLLMHRHLRAARTNPRRSPKSRLPRNQALNS